MSLRAKRSHLIFVVDRRDYLLLLLVSLLLCILPVSGCATVEKGQYPEGPYIISTYPSTGDFNISRYTDINVRFSEAMDSATEIGFEMLFRGLRVEGVSRWSDANTVIVFRPSKPLEANNTYQCILREGKSKDGKSLVGMPYIWIFTTGN